MKRSRANIQSAETRSRTYFQFDHLSPGPALAISSVWFNRRGKTNQVSVSYKLIGHGAFRSPRNASSWLDDKDDLFVTKEIEAWKARVNQDTDYSEVFFPDFFIKQRPNFIRWSNKTAKPISIEGYLFYLGRYVFPYFVQKLREQDPSRWRTYYSEWETYLAGSIDSLDGRNKARTALRRYLKFLEAKGKLQVTLIMPRNEATKRAQREGKKLPGELPKWADVSSWIRSLPRGRDRWVLTICAAFAVRISEALTIHLHHLIGDDDVDGSQSVNEIVKAAMATEKIVAFLNVEEAQKRAIRDQNVSKIAGDSDDDPKSGPYTAGCTSLEMGQLIADLCEGKEFDGEADYDSVYKFIKAQKPLVPRHIDVKA